MIEKRQMQHHPAAVAFPLMDKARYRELVEDIARNGQHEAITLCDGKILDGRNRYNACRELGMEPHFRGFDGNPWDYVWSLNGQRRDLVAEQRYLIWKHVNEQSEQWRAKRRRIQAEANRKRSEAAKEQPRTPDGRRLAEKQVVEHNVPLPDRHAGKHAKASAAKVNMGAVARGDKLAKERPDLAEKVRLGQMKPAEAHREMKREEQRDRLKELASRQVDPLTKQYHVIVIDPPWPMQKIERDCRPNQAEMDYPTMSESELLELHIPAFESCHLWLWATHRFLPMAFRLLEGWNFKYVCTFVWHKPGGFQPVGLPQYNCEFALYARRGNPEFLDTRGLSVCFSAKRGRHSEKPNAFYEIIRKATGEPRVDMFGRREIAGFDCWGKEAPNRSVAK